MNALKVVKNKLAKMEKGTISAADFTADMTFSGPVPEPLNREEYVFLMKNLVRGIPDWKFNAHEFSVEGDTVRAVFTITGTHTRTLQPFVPGMPVLPATRKIIHLPEERTTITLRGDRIREIRAEVGPHGGVMGLLTQLEVHLKKAA